MLAPEYPANEPERLAALRRLHLVHAPDEAQFDRVVRVARYAFRVPIAFISLVEQHRQYFKSAQGLSQRDTNRSISFCGHAILKPEETLVVPDAMADARFADNPLVLGPPFIRFYAGRPLKSPDGQAIGTLCLVDTAPRRFTPEDDQILGDLARWLDALLQIRSLGDAQNQLVQELSAAERQSLLDPLLGLWNRRALEDLLTRFRLLSEQRRQPFTVGLVDVDYFKRINDAHGHGVGDEALRALAQALRKSVREHDALGRWGGEEFLVLFAGVGRREAPGIGEKLRLAVRETTLVLASGQPLNLTVSLGLAVFDPEARVATDVLLEAADQALYRAKAAGRDRVELAD